MIGEAWLKGAWGSREPKDPGHHYIFDETSCRRGAIMVDGGARKTLSARSRNSSNSKFY